MIAEKVKDDQSGLYIYLLFPIAFAFLLTFGGARLISYYHPGFFVELYNHHIHHYAWGIIILTVAGYLALVFDDAPRAKYLISLLYGFGAGLAFDEFGIWLKLSDRDPDRWSYDGLLLVVALIFIVVSAKPGVRMLRILWPLKRTPKQPNNKAFPAPIDSEA